MLYQIYEGMSVSTSPDNRLEQPDIDRALLALTGFKPTLVSGRMAWARGVLRYWLPGEGDSEADIEALSADLNARPLSPALDMEFAQMLLRSTPMVITPVVTLKGQLVGEWHVENNPIPATGDVMTNGHQLHSYRHETLPVAIAMVFLQTQGIGQQAWIYIGERETDEPELHYVMPTDDVTEKLNGVETFIRADTLDQFAATGVPSHVLADEFEKAGLKRVIATVTA
jgi:hypothetical protein